MDPLDDKANFRGKAPKERNPLRLTDPAVINRPHICGFFNSHDDEFRVVIPFILEGLERGEKAFHTVDPKRYNAHLQQLASAGIDVTTLLKSRQLEVHDWNQMHLRDGLFDESRTLAGWEQIGKRAKQDGFPLIRFVTPYGVGFGRQTGPWLLAGVRGPGELLVA